MQSKKIFVICPVRRPHVGFLKRTLQIVLKILLNIEDGWTKIQNTIKAYVAKLEADGCIVYWPYRDNPYQESDPIGLRIITHNRGFMIDADEVHIFYDKSSTGSIFDFGMLFMALEIFNDKEIRLINNQDIQPTPKKSFENILLALRKEFGVTEDMLGDLY